MLKLYAFDRSPFGWKVRVALAEKNVPYEMIVPENKNEDPAFARLNPLRKTPVLVLEDGRSIYESSVINEYLEEAFPKPAMLPKDLFERARVRMIEDTYDQYVRSSAISPTRSSTTSRRSSSAGRPSRWITSCSRSRAGSCTSSCSVWKPSSAASPGSAAISSRWPTRPTCRR